MKTRILSLFLLICSCSATYAQSPIKVEEDSLGVYNIDIIFENLHAFYERLNRGEATPEDLTALSWFSHSSVDTLTIKKTFTDKGAENRLTVQVLNPCICSDEMDFEDYRVNGLFNAISAHIENEKYTDSLLYYNPHVAMSLIDLREKEIIFKTVARKTAAIIPFSYCGNADMDITISYILFYDRKKYLIHINYRSRHEGFEDYHLYDNLDEKLKELPTKLKKAFTEILKETTADKYITQ
ncbi:hypothetical protein [Dysgonomonas sp. 25]|uniref:hypothetical protein n=1 Tax=Dysgonomonas sp. 25 TaxID=2302933 RepID=UPI0013D78612|nr:hypothetical protein [Dysgonomonas sp. 25]NDV69866.1 hypothetical protein [Dysgonomonas sp. 25]